MPSVRKIIVNKNSVILTTSFISAIGLTMSGLGFVFFMEEVHQVTPSVIGWIVSARSIAYTLGCFILYPIVRRIIPRYAVAFSLFGMGATMLLITLSRHLYSVLAYSMFFGLVHSLFWPPLMGWLSHGTEGGKLGRNLSHFNMSFSIGMMIGPIIGGYLAEGNATMPMYVSSLIFGFAMSLVLLASFTPIIREDHYRDHDTGKIEKPVDMSTPLRYCAWIGFFITSTVSGVLMTIYPLHATADLVFDKSHVGVLFFSRSLLSTLTFLVLGRTTFWHFKGSQMIMGMLITTLTITALVYAISFSFHIVLFASLGILASVSYANSIFHGVSGSLNRSQRMAFHEALLQGGFVVGSSIGGLIYQYYSMKWLYVVCIGFLVLGALTQGVLVFLFKRRDIQYKISQ